MTASAVGGSGQSAFFHNSSQLFTVDITYSECRFVVTVYDLNSYISAKRYYFCLKCIFPAQE
jgi:hypothetical protein